MRELLLLAAASAAGLLLGAIFFGGLWFTVRKGVSSQRPALWFFFSLMLRMSVALAGFIACFRRALGAPAGVSARICRRAACHHAAE